jgi:serine phosphatase RsbU (regulator of sigma subunit)
MSDLVHPGVRELTPSRSRPLLERTLLSHLLRNELASSGPGWLPLAFVIGAIAAVAYADDLVDSISLGYLYVLPLAVGAIFLRKTVSYGLIAICILLHDYYYPSHINPRLRMFHNLTEMVCFAFVVFLIQRYVGQREALGKTVQRQRDDLLKDVELAAQVQRLFLPSGKPAIPGLEIAGMMHPARGVGGDYYDHFSIGPHTTQVIIADVAGKGIPAALLMSATAATMRLEANHDRNMLEQIERLNTGIHSVSETDRFVTLFVAEIDSQKQKLRYVNCGHNPAVLFRAKTDALSLLNSSCPPIGILAEETCELASEDLIPGDVLVFYTDGVTEAENRLGEEFGMERLCATVHRHSSLSAEDLMRNIYNAAADFCGDEFNDDVTILVVKCKFDGALDYDIVTAPLAANPGE